MSPPVIASPVCGKCEVVPGSVGGPAARLKKLGKEGLATGWAAVIQVNMIWLVSGATGILNLLKKSMPRMGPATAACKKLKVKSLP